MRGWMVAPLVLALAACAETERAAPASPSPAPVAVAPAASLPSAGTLPGDLVPAFQAKVLRTDAGASREETVDARVAKGARVFVVMSVQCPYCEEAVAPLQRIEASFQPRGVDFVYLYSTRAEPSEEKVAWHARKGLRGGQVLEADAAIARLLKADKTPTAWLVDARGVILYRGSVAEAAPGGGPGKHWLADALDEHLAGKPVTVRSTEPAG
jgi:hypothetical protein